MLYAPTILMYQKQIRNVLFFPHSCNIRRPVSLKDACQYFSRLSISLEIVAKYSTESASFAAFLYSLPPGRPRRGSDLPGTGPAVLDVAVEQPKLLRPFGNGRLAVYLATIVGTVGRSRSRGSLRGLLPPRGHGKFLCMGSFAIFNWSRRLGILPNSQTGSVGSGSVSFN